MAYQVKKYGWRKDSLDHRDYIFSAPYKGVDTWPQSVDLTNKMPPIFTQQLGDCTANAVCAAVWYDAIKEGHPSVEPSRLFQYYNTRVLENTVDSDSGASIRNAIKATVINGFCPESDWPYNVDRFKIKPPDSAYTDAKKELVCSYYSVPQVLSQMHAALAQGMPICIGFTVFASFESLYTLKTGVVNLPRPGEEILGGHAVLLCSYDNSERWFGFRNSWGQSFGENGYGKLSYDYLLNPNLASDFWIIQSVP